MAKIKTAAGKWVMNALNRIDAYEGGSNCHGSGDTFYSYGTPIARFDGEAFLLTTQKWSQSTTRHLNCVRRAIAEVGETAIDVPSVS